MVQVGVIIVSGAGRKMPTACSNGTSVESSISEAKYQQCHSDNLWRFQFEKRKAMTGMALEAGNREEELTMSTLLLIEIMKEVVDTGDLIRNLPKAIVGR